jgi:acetolactate synthase I/II/III large subunit
MSDQGKQTVAQLIIKCLENEGVEYIFGLPGEENIEILDALINAKIRFILTRHEQAASFMADIYGRLTRKAGVCLSTLGPGAINLLLGTADAHLDSSPLVALTAQASLDRLNKESHQVIDLEQLFRPITKWVSMLALAGTTTEVIRKAFKVAQMERCGATAVIVPEDIMSLPTNLTPLPVRQPKLTLPDPSQIDRAVALINAAKNPLMLVGYGACRQRIGKFLKNFADRIPIPVATTFMAKGVLSAKHPRMIGTIGFMKHDYTNFGFDNADLVITVGYDLVEYPPQHWNPKADKEIIHVHTIPAEVDCYYTPSVGIQGSMAATLEALANQIEIKESSDISMRIRQFIENELEEHAKDPSFPLKPQKIVADLRTALQDKDIVLCDTGALKMWMARLYPCYEPDTCLISNSLATMGFSVPGAVAARLVYPDRKIVAVTGDGAFLMNAQDLETAKREKTPFVVLIWRDDSYGLIEWKEELQLGRSAFVRFTNPDFVQFAESFGIRGYQITAADQLLPVLKESLESNELAIIDCPVDYSENMKLISRLGQLTETI